MPPIKDSSEINFTMSHSQQKQAAHGVDEVTFNIGANVLSSSVQIESDRSLIVPAITLEAILDKHQFQTCTLVCDIEGGEIDLIKYESSIIKKMVSTIFVEVHPDFTGQTAVDEMVAELVSLGFEIMLNRWSNIVLQKIQEKMPASQTDVV